MDNTKTPVSLSPHHRLKDDEMIQSLQKKYSQTTTVEKLAHISAFFLNKPYILGALGEGKKGTFDQSPLYRTDGFDCVTFVNTVLALTLTDNLINFQKSLITLNYLSNTATYQNRCHFISLDWNRHNSIDNNILEDVTKKIKDKNQRPLAKTANTIIDKNNFFQHRTLNDIKLLNPISPPKAQTLLHELQRLASDIKPQAVTIDYLPIESLFDSQQNLNADILNQFPTAFVLEMIRPGWDLTQAIGTHLHVSHLGFCFKNKDTWIFRHASSQCKKVTDIPLSTYLNQYRNHKTLKGVNIQKIKKLSSV